MNPAFAGGGGGGLPQPRTSRTSFRTATAALTIVALSLLLGMVAISIPEIAVLSTVVQASDQRVPAGAELEMIETTLTTNIGIWESVLVLELPDTSTTNSPYSRYGSDRADDDDDDDDSGGEQITVFQELCDSEIGDQQGEDKTACSNARNARCRAFKGLSVVAVAMNVFAAAFLITGMYTESRRFGTAAGVSAAISVLCYLIFICIALAVIYTGDAKPKDGATCTRIAVYEELLDDQTERVQDAGGSVTHKKVPGATTVMFIVDVVLMGIGSFLIITGIRHQPNDLESFGGFDEAARA